MRATFSISGTVAIRSSPEMAGTGAFFTGSIFMAMVPPVAIRRTTGRFGAGVAFGSAAAGGREGEGCCAWAAAQARRRGRPGRQAMNGRMATSEQVPGRAVTLVRHAVQAAQRLQAPGRPAARRRGAD